MKHQNKIKKKYKILFLIGIFLLGLIYGLFVGFSLSNMFFVNTFENIVSNIQIHNLEVGFNETYIMDRLNQTMIEAIKLK